MDGELCAYCAGDDSFEELTREHFALKGLWDGARPTFTQTIPVHDSCNKRYSDDNEYFRDVLVMEEGAKNHPEVQKLHAGKIRRKFENRIGSMRKTLKGLSMVEVVTESGIFLGYVPAFRVDWERMNRVLYNVMRGVYYVSQNKPLPADWQWQILRHEDPAFGGIMDLVNQMPPAWSTFGDTVFGCRYINHEGAIACLMQFYCHRVFFGSAVSAEFVAAHHEHVMKSLLINPSD